MSGEMESEVVATASIARYVNDLIENPKAAAAALRVAQLASEKFRLHPIRS
jgi:hypothetical protein